MLKLIKGADLYAPDYMGKQDILVAGDKIASVGKDLDPPSGYECKIVDAYGKIIYPGFIDIHSHFTGADDGQSPMGRSFDMQWQDIVEAGVTTAIGCMGKHIWVRNLDALYLKAIEYERMGITTYILTGSFRIPPPTLTGQIRKDLYLIDKVVGLKTAISDPISAHHTWRDLAAITSEVHLGSKLVSKGAITHIHVGTNPTRMDVMLEMVEKTGFDPQQILPTHVNRFEPDVIEQGIEFVKQGGVVDLSVMMRKEEGGLTGLKTEYTVKRMLDSGCTLDNITISTDGNVPMPIRNEDGKQIGLYIASMDFLRREVRDIVTNGLASFSDALKLVTTNPARILKINNQKGDLQKGYDADFVIAESINTLKIDKVYAKGKLLVDNGKSLFQGHFQQDPYYNQYH